MPKNAVTDWSTNAGENTDIGGTDIGENCQASGINDAIRTVMAQLRSFFAAVAITGGTVYGITGLRVGQSSTNAPGAGNTTEGAGIDQAGTVHASSSTNVSSFNRNGTDGLVQQLRREGVAVGSITVTTTGSNFNTASDYRLKENVVSISDGIDRVKQLSPSRFNFIANPGVAVDGFIAHEVSGVVPEAVQGEFDGAEMQAMDASRLVPLLTAALQEAIARIEALEAANP